MATIAIIACEDYFGKTVLEALLADERVERVIWVPYKLFSVRTMASINPKLEIAPRTDAGGPTCWRVNASETQLQACKAMIWCVPRSHVFLSFKADHSLLQCNRAVDPAAVSRSFPNNLNANWSRDSYSKHPLSAANTFLAAQSLLPTRASEVQKPGDGSSVSKATFFFLTILDEPKAGLKGIYKTLTPKIVQYEDTWQRLRQLEQRRDSPIRMTRIELSETVCHPPTVLQSVGARFGMWQCPVERFASQVVEAAVADLPGLQNAGPSRPPPYAAV